MARLMPLIGNSIRISVFHLLDDRPVDRYGPVDATPDGFERLVAALFGSLGARVENLELRHHDTIPAADGACVFDATARFEALGVRFLILIEAKLQQRPVERGVVQVLHQKLMSTGAQKAIVASSSGFQRGAIEFGDEHGVALVRIVELDMLFETRSRDAPKGPRREGLAGVRVRGADRGTQFTTLSGQPDYMAEMLELVPSER